MTYREAHIEALRRLGDNDSQILHRQAIASAHINLDREIPGGDEEAFIDRLVFALRRFRQLKRDELIAEAVRLYSSSP